MGFSGAGELRSDSKTFMDDGRKRKGTISAQIGRNFGFAPSTGLLRRCRFKVLKTLLFYAVSELAAGEFPVYKRAVPTT